MNLVCFRYRGGDEFDQNLTDNLDSSDDLYLTHTRLDDKLTLRMSIGQTLTGERHVRNAWQKIQETVGGVEKGNMS